MENFDLFHKAMREYNQTKPEKENACDHERTFKSSGWEICTVCFLYVRRILSQDIHSYMRGYAMNKPKESQFSKIREEMGELIDSVVRQGGTCPSNGVFYYSEPPEAGLPRELIKHFRELCQACVEHKTTIRCHTRSLCAALLWDKVKSLYPSSMTLTEFSDRTGVSVPTIINTRKKLI